MSREEIEKLDDIGISSWDSHDPEAFVSILADDFVLRDWTMAEPIRDKDGARAYVNAWITAFPDIRVTRHNRVVGDDAVAAEVEFTGTNTGPMVMGGMEMPPTGKSVVGRGSYIARVKDGKVVEFSAHPDAAGMMMQMGLMPGM
jgi:predicted ester cyclase